MNAEAEQYLERLARLSYDTRGEFIGQDPWEVVDFIHKEEIATATAVAQQLLRDVIAEIEGLYVQDDYKNGPYWAEQHIREWAAEHGIDL